MTLSAQDLRAALDGDAASTSLAVLEAVIRAERAAQASYARHADRSDAAVVADLDAALLIRAVYNVTTTRPAKPENVVRVGIAGPGVRDLEAPYSARAASVAARTEAPTPSSAPSSSSSSSSDDFDPAVGGNVGPTKSYVGDDVERARAMLELEESRTNPRPSLVEWLTNVIDTVD